MGYLKLFLIFTILKFAFILLIDWSFDDEDLSTEIILSDASDLEISFMKPFIRYDSLMFYTVAKEFYKHEKIAAFFPLYPMTAKFLRLCFLFMGINIHLGFCFIIVSLIFTFLGLFAFRKICEIVFKGKQEEIIEIATRMFIFSPANVFFSAAYSESIFFFLCCMFLLAFNEMFERDGIIGRIIFCILNIGFISLAGIARTTSIFYAPFVAYYLGTFFLRGRSLKTFLLCLFAILIFMIIVFLPYSMALKFNYNQYCVSNISKDKPEWCYDKSPNIYSSIQKRFWVVGFFKSFYLVSPDANLWAFFNLTVVIIALKKYLEGNWMEFFQIKKLNIFLKSFNVVILEKLVKKRNARDNLKQEDFENAIHFSFILLTLVSALYAYFPSSTRFLAVHPSYYILIARLWNNGTGKNKKFIIGLIISHLVIGCSFFSNYYMWP